LLSVIAVLAVNLTDFGRNAPHAVDLVHDHPPGPHGGAVVAVDQSNDYHAEAAIGSDGRLRLYTFGRLVLEPAPIASDYLCASVRLHESDADYPVMLRAEPPNGDTPGTSSRFAGRVPPDARRGHARLVVWSLPAGGGRFRFEVSVPVLEQNVADFDRVIAEEAALYATPGGRYVADDIRANGPLVASIKFRGERPEHRHDAKVGGFLCPVSGLRANDRFNWVVGGQRYSFCCPPCIDEFVRAAKERPAELREPNFYRVK
jgi:hypothetical protein